MNTRLLRKIQKVILEEPRRIRMSSWVTDPGTLSKKEIPPCGTVACIAGWAVYLKDKKEFERIAGVSSWRVGSEILAVASKFLGIDHLRPMDLFNKEAWPDKFRTKIRGEGGTLAYARVVSDRIDHYIKTKGRE